MTLTLAPADPPLPSGPLSVRVFHLEVFTGPHDLVGETWARAFTNPQMWARASRDFTTRDVGGDQAFAVYPPVEAAFVRVVCTRNAARARLSDDEYTELETRADIRDDPIHHQVDAQEQHHSVLENVVAAGAGARRERGGGREGDHGQERAGGRLLPGLEI